jgi:hypothetical protein
VGKGLKVVSYREPVGWCDNRPAGESGGAYAGYGGGGGGDGSSEVGAEMHRGYRLLCLDPVVG